jgi:hypothetical protein
MALVDVDNDDLVGGPAQRDRAAFQVVLTQGRLGVGENLFDSGLSDVFSELENVAFRRILWGR